MRDDTGSGGKRKANGKGSMTARRTPRGARWAAGVAVAFTVAVALSSAGLVVGGANSANNKTVVVQMALGSPNSASGHGDWIEINSFSWGVENPATANGGYTGHPQVKDFQVTKHPDMASAVLLGACLDGSKAPDVYVRSTPPAGSSDALVEYRLKGVLVSRFISGTSGGAAQGFDEIGITFEEITVTYAVGNETHEDSWEAPVV